MMNLHILTFLQNTQDNSWMNMLSKMITSPLISLVLTCVIFLGFLYQLYSKRINIIGIIATLALLVFFLGFLIEGSMSFLTFILFIVGVIFLILELFVVGAVLGITGLVLIIFSIVSLGDNLLQMLVNVVIALILAIIEWVILVKFFKRKIPFFENVVLKDSTSRESGYTSHDDLSHLVGEVANTVTDLRPSGVIVLNDDRIDAVSDGPFILKDKPVKIIEVEGTRVVVREIE
ncbi:NfeD family protein [Staphylococcus massiliensis]|uniref:Uncharacterized protein n=1 Tax=Staphylococcus massiliensis S46 TaxID=1229783 RepID=K9ARN0_9STAP|nr:NfeD family protein [Staphylococcus massiliensis]EKU49914.1 hypothetical protein C273_03430 [Staphylococcus massiliensis S46]MCG3399018.1 serine protease [Staphylococcus massiliensis]MCG3400984.1 serine protease [Staphylococcus massiliensis]MCG3412519.1 serine protease [Staphylococcus massiliensis]PNZ98913.1 serine protease [Staphylococcus massiliensis CCUG 55927]